MKNNQDFRRLEKRIKKFDWSFLFNAYIIVCISLVFVYSATSIKSNSFFYKEIVWAFMGGIVYLVFSLIDYKVYSKYSKLIYIGNIMFLISVYILGIERLGAKRWIKLGPLTIQPSEFAKFFLVLTFSEYLANFQRKEIMGFKGMFKAGIHIIPPFLLILKQPDLGTSLVIIFLYYVLIFLAGVELRPFVVINILNIISIPFAYFFVLKEYQKQRILTFLNPEADILGSGWNVIQSMIAVGSGGIYGKGILEGTQNKLKFLPESHTDFIFSVLSEETGFIGSTSLIILYTFLIYKIISVGKKAEDNFGKLVCYGVSAIFFFHVMVNVGMVIGIMPVTGLPLLLMSYGGSSYLFSFMMLGVVQSIKVYGR